ERSGLAQGAGVRPVDPLPCGHVLCPLGLAPEKQCDLPMVEMAHALCEPMAAAHPVPDLRDGDLLCPGEAELGKIQPRTPCASGPSLNRRDAVHRPSPSLFLAP